MSDPRPDHLIIRYLSNEASAIEQEQLFEWVSRTHINQKVFNEYVSAWSKQKDQEPTFNSERALQKLNAMIDRHETSEKRTTISWNRWNIAAAIVFLITSGFILFYYGIDAYKTRTAPVLTALETTDKVQKITLSDGSIITLNAYSVLKYPEDFSGNTRYAYLTGEAFFEIAKDSSKPFIIHTENITTHVVGTSFNINSSDKGIVISVATGSVKVSDGTNTTELKPYEKAIYVLNSFTKQSTDLSEISWNDRTLKFDDTPLEQVTKKLEKHYEVKFILKNEALKNCSITGKFTNEPLANVLQAMEYSLGIKATQVNDIITLSGTGCQ